MSAVFLDTVGLIALWDESDQWHALALEAYQKINAKTRQPVCTSTSILLECGNAAARRSYRKNVAQFRNEIERHNGLIVPTKSDWNQAWIEYENAQVGEAGLVDCVSFVVMRRLGLKDVFSNDKHFASAGFNTLF